MEQAKITTNHEDIMRWVEKRGGNPARVKGTDVKGSSGVLLIDYPGYSGTQTLEDISWDEFFKGFEENELAFLYEDEKKADSQSHFSKLVSRDSGQQWKSRAARAGGSVLNSKGNWDGNRSAPTRAPTAQGMILRHVYTAISHCKTPDGFSLIRNLSRAAH